MWWFPGPDILDPPVFSTGPTPTTPTIASSGSCLSQSLPELHRAVPACLLFGRSVGSPYCGTKCPLWCIVSFCFAFGAPSQTGIKEGFHKCWTKWMSEWMNTEQCAKHFCELQKIWSSPEMSSEKKNLLGSLLENEMQTALCKFKHLPLNFGNWEVKSLWLQNPHAH